MKGMARSNIGYTVPGAPRPYAWNPGGMGCSGGCDGCWARALAARFSACPDCRAFKVHFHPERLDQPADTKKPGVVLCNFTNDWLDNKRPDYDIYLVLEAMDAARWHTYVTLTKQAYSAGSWQQGKNEYRGLTIRTQAEADEKLPTFLSVPGNLWLSLEPIWDGVNFMRYLIEAKLATGRGVVHCPILGVIVGHDNRRGAPGTDTLDHIRSVVAQCQAAGIRVYCKQIWVHVCPVCGQRFEMDGDCCCTGPAPRLRPKLLRASHPDEYALYPADLKVKNLPWPQPQETP